MENESFIALISIVIALIAVLLTLWQNFLTRKAVQSQVLLSLKQLSSEADYFGGMREIIALKDYHTYTDYLQNEPEDIRKKIYDTVDFLNFVAHLVEDNLLPRETAWHYYFHPYRICNKKLVTWWLAGVREEHFQGFTGFEKMCTRIGSISEESIRKREEKYRQSRTNI